MVPVVEYVLSTVMILTSLMILRCRDIVRASRIYIAQTLALIGVFLCTAIRYPWFYAWAGSAAITKAFLAPYLITWAARRTRVYESEDPYLGDSASLIVALILVAISFGAMEAARIADPVFMGVSLSLAMIGMLVIVSRRNILKQIFGFLYFENGSHLALAVLAPEIPETVDVGIATDAIVLILVLCIIARHIYRELGSLNADLLTVLKYS
jgi:hydrogenase-4 component E